MLKFIHLTGKEFCLRPPLKICLRKVTDLAMKLRRFQNYTLKLMVTKSNALKRAANNKQAELDVCVERKRLLLEQKSAIDTSIHFASLLLVVFVLQNVLLCSYLWDFREFWDPRDFRNWDKIWLYFVITFKWLCCHLKVVAATNIGFLPKFSMSAAMGMHNFYVRIRLKLKIASFFLWLNFIFKDF